MKRTVEIVFGIIGSFFNVIAIASMGLMVVGINELKNNTQFQNEMITEFERQAKDNPESSQMDVQTFTTNTNLIMNNFGPLFWFILICFIISLILGIIAIIQAVKAKDKKANFAGGLFIAAAVLAGFLSPTSIVYYIAAIICFVRKPKEGIDGESTSIHQEG